MVTLDFQWSPVIYSNFGGDLVLWSGVGFACVCVGFKSHSVHSLAVAYDPF